MRFVRDLFSSPAPPLAPLSSRKRVYPNELGLTALQILGLLVRCPMTERELTAALSVTTAGFHLPRLRERGYIYADRKADRRFIYSLTTAGRDIARASHLTDGDVAHR